MPAAGRKRMEGGLPILSQSVAIGRNRSRLVAIGRDWSQSVAIGRNRSQSVAIGRDWSRLVAIGRDWSQSVAIGRNRSRLVAIGRDWSRLVAPKQKTRRKHKKSPIPQSGIGLHNVARRSALLASNELLAQIHMQALKAFC